MNYFTYLLVFFSTFTLSAIGHAEGSQSSYPRMTIEEASQQRDETRMSIEGTFLRQNRGEEDEFIFRDGAGSEILVYDRDAGRDIQLNVPVLIEGAIDRGNLLRREFNLHRVLSLTLEESTPPKSTATVPNASAAESRDGVFVHLSSGPDNARSVLMALTLADTFSGERPVLIYADLEAVALFTATAPSVSSSGYLPSAERVSNLLEAGAMIRVCPTCLSAAGLSSADLMEGVKLADKREFFTFTTGRILTFDY